MVTLPLFSCIYNIDLEKTQVEKLEAEVSAVHRLGRVVCPLVAVVMLRSCHQMEAILVFKVVLCLAAV
jgi:hypothetical protein